MKVGFYAVLAIVSMAAMPTNANEWKTDNNFIANRVGVKCGDDKYKMDRTLKVLHGYTDEEIRIKEKKFESKISETIAEPGWCEMYRKGMAKAQKSQSNSTSETLNSSDAHSACLDAKDYEGCIKVKSGHGNVVEEKCDEIGWCQVLTKGRDRYGTIKPMGWLYYEYDGGIAYLNPASGRRVPHKGQPSRYITYEAKVSYYQKSVFPTSTSIGQGHINCSTYGSSTNCTSTGPSTFSTPGVVGGGVGFRYSEVIDCKDQTSASFKNGKRMSGIYRSWGKWSNISRKSITYKFSNDLCMDAASLEVKNMKL